MVRDLRLMKSVIAVTLTAVAAVTVNAQPPDAASRLLHGRPIQPDCR